MKLLHDLRAINNTTSNLPRICMKCVTRSRDKEPWWAFHTDALQKANHKSGGKSSTIGCHKVTNQGAEQKNKIWRFRHSSYVMLLFDKRTAEARQKHGRSTMSESKSWIWFSRAITFVPRLDTTWTIKFDCGLHHICLPKKCIMASCIQTYIRFTNIHSLLNLPIGALQEQ